MWQPCKMNGVRSRSDRQNRRTVTLVAETATLLLAQGISGVRKDAGDERPEGSADIKVLLQPLVFHALCVVRPPLVLWLVMWRHARTVRASKPHGKGATVCKVGGHVYGRHVQKLVIQPRVFRGLYGKSQAVVTEWHFLRKSSFSSSMTSRALTK